MQCQTKRGVQKKEVQQKKNSTPFPKSEDVVAKSEQ